MCGAMIIGLAACSTMQPSRPTPLPIFATATGPLFDGKFDNREQTLTAPASGIAIPHVVFTLHALAKTDWFTWRTQLQGTAPAEALWAMNVARTDDGGMVVTPYRSLVATAGTGEKFDPQQWTPLTACALRGSLKGTTLNLVANAAACATIAPGVGAAAALLPLTMHRDGEWLRVRLYADQARGAQAHEEARRVRWFGGWAAINGGGPNAKADNQDWHMDRGLRLGSEGGSAKLTWRDGTASGYSISLERMTYTERKMQVLKLSVQEDSDGHVLAYAWANPDATRIGINLGWLQIGLEEVASPNSTVSPPTAP